MRFAVAPLLSPERVEAMRSALLAPAVPWRSGVETAGWHARTVKRNRQLAQDVALHGELAQQVREALLAHPLVASAALPVRVHGLLFSRCGVGEGYGRHVDNAYMKDGRSDLSFTLFLSDPASYTGGALMLETPAGEEPVRLAAGAAIVYPSTLLHRVEPVHSGERLAAVGWIQSRVREADQRELLFELDTARRALFASQDEEVFALINRSYTNLLRRWGD
jgi:PKHD-type hydroxylase